MIVYDTLDFKITDNTAVAIGKFDGVHLGHQMLIRKIIAMKKLGLKALIFTFEPPAHKFFAGNKNIIYDITTRDEKRRIFEELGVDYLIEYPFNSETSKIEPEIFIKEILVKQIKMKYIVAGEDVSFGYRARGDSSMIIDRSKEYDYSYRFLEKITFMDEIISSSLIREKLSDGIIEVVTQLLGRNYSIYGKVVKGNQIGRTMELPTANVLPDNNKCIPPRGVYFSRVNFNGIKYNSITNIGINPTIENEGLIANLDIKVETYLFDVDIDLYGEYIEISLLHFKRGEVKFNSLVDLKKQIMKDKDDARTYFKYLKS